MAYFTQHQHQHHQDPVNCQVCDLPISDGNARKTASDMPVCRACKKFFRRNRSRQVNSLICISGTTRCGVGKATATQIASGVVWRMACPRCRFEKCIALGLRHSSKNNNQSKQSSSSSFSASSNLDRSVSDRKRSYVSVSDLDDSNTTSAQQAIVMLVEPNAPDMKTIETTICRIISATGEFFHNLDNSPLKRNVKYFENETHAWISSMEQYEYLARSISSFLKAMPGYSDIPMNERCSLFSSSLLPMVYTGFNRSEPTVVAMAKENAAQFIAYFPELSYSIQQTNHIWSVIANWNPSQLEISCLLVYLFILNYCNLRRKNGSTENDRRMSLPGTRHLKEIVDIAVSRQYNGNPTGFNARLTHLRFVAETMIECSQRYTFAAVELASRRPHLFASSQIHAAVIEENQKASLPNQTPMNTNARGGVATSYDDVIV